MVRPATLGGRYGVVWMLVAVGFAAVLTMLALIS
jgi:hypothetical protein